MFQNERSRHQKYNREEVIKTRKTVFLSCIIVNGIIGITFGIYAITNFSGLYYLLPLLGTILITGLGMLDYFLKQRFQRIFIISSAFFTLLIGIMIIDMPFDYAFNFSLTIMIGEIVVICYNYALGQKEDRSIIYEEKKRKQKQNEITQ